MTQPQPGQPIPPIPQGPLNAPVHGPRLPGPPGPQPPFGAPHRLFRPTLPVTQTDYVMFWRTPAWRWWRPVVALVLTLVLGLMVATVLYAISVGIDAAAGRIDPLSPDYDPFDITALGFLANNLGLASLIVIAALVSTALFSQRAGFLASVVGRMRWDWLCRCVLIILPIWLVFFALDTWLSLRAGVDFDLAVNPDTGLLIIGILLTTPLQAAGEEFGFRGVFNRAVASFFRNGRAGLVAGAVVSSLLFAAAHGAGDVWLNVFYLWFGFATCYVTWRTGGLEAAIAMHVVNNMLAEVVVPFSDIGDMFNRQAGTAGPEILIMMVAVGLASALIGWQAGRRGIQVTSAPGESMALAQAAPPTGMPSPCPDQPAPHQIRQTTGTAQPVPATGQQLPTGALPMPPQPPMFPKPQPPQPGPRPQPQPGPETPPGPPRTASLDGPAPLFNPRPWESP